MKKKLNRLIAILLTMTTVMSCTLSIASAGTIADGSQSAKMSLTNSGNSFLETTAGTKLRVWSYEYATNDGVSGPGYCIDHGLDFTSKRLPITGKYNANAKAAGAVANGFPQLSLEEFLRNNASSAAALSGLTEDEYSYATQIAVWAALGQIHVEGTAFTKGREILAQPTSGLQEMRVFRALQLILKEADTWTKVYEPGMYIRTDMDVLGGNTSIPADMTLDFAADNERYGMKREVINGISYYTKEYIFSSATSTIHNENKIDIWAEGAPAGTIFTDVGNKVLEAGTYKGKNTFKVETKKQITDLNPNGVEFTGIAKLCVPVNNADNSGEIIVNCGAYVAQYDLYMAYNETTYQQSYILADPNKGPFTANAVLNWGGIQTDTGNLEVTKIGEGNNVLPGAVFTLSGTDGTNRTGVSDKDGKIRWEYLDPLVTYTLTETEAPSGYSLAEPLAFKIEAARTNYVTVQDSTSKRLTVHKIDKQTGYSLVGAVIAFEQIDGSFYTTRKTDHAGMIQLSAEDLPIGSYSIYELNAPEGYEKDSTPKNINWDGKTDMSLTFENVRKQTLVIYKCDEENNFGLTGATFEVYKEGKLVTTVTTNENGLAYVSGISSGYYTVRETIAPEGYVLDGKDHNISINNYNPAIEDDPRITIKNVKEPSLKIIKLDGDSNKRLPGVTFEVYRDSLLLGAFTTDSFGEILMYDLNPGTYLVKEVGTAPGYVLGSSPQEIELVKGDDPYTLVFRNKLKPGIHLVKLDSTSLLPLVNAKYMVSEIGGGFSKEYLTDINGEINLTGLNPGTYIVKELSAPDGYLIDDAERTIKINGGENAEFVFTNTLKPSLKVIKYDAEKNIRLPGASFRISHIADGSHYLDRITDSNGEIYLNGLEPGVYSVKEMAAPSGYILDETEYHVELMAGKESQLVVNNLAKPDLKIVKTDANTGEPVADVTFTIKKADGSTITTEGTDAKGEVLVTDLEPGVYEIREHSVPDNYILNKEHQMITLEPNRLATVHFENHPKPGLVINKVDSITNNPIENAKFKVTYASDNTSSGEINELGIFYTDENGKIKLTSLKAGWYKVKELEPAKGYQMPSDNERSIYIKAGEYREITLKNDPLNALVVWKYDTYSGEALEGAEFTLKYLSGTSGTGGTVIGTFKTSKNGAFTVTGLKEGTYIVEEVKTTDDHMISGEPKTVYISGEKQDVIELTFGNPRKGSLIIEKKDSETGKPLEGVTFKITNSKGEYTGNNGGKISSNGLFYTDKDGRIYLSQLNPDTYIVTEEKTIKGYTIDENERSQTVYVGTNEAKSLVFYNTKMSGILIHKIDADTKEGIYGVKFMVYDSGKNPIGEYTSDQDGYVYIDDLEGSGTFYVKEMEAEGYLVDKEMKTIFVEAGKTSHITWKNTPITGQIQVYKYAAEDNEITGTKKGEPLPGAVYEIVNERSGKVVSYITTDAGGVAATKAIPLGRYLVKEVKAPAYWQLENEAMDVTLEYPGQIIKLSSFDEASEVLVSLTKTGTKSVLAGGKATYTFSFANESNVALDNFYFHDKLPYDVSSVSKITTGTYSDRLTYRVLYKTNYEDYKVLASNLISTKNYGFSLNAVNLQRGEYITDIYFDFGKVPSGFQTVVKPSLSVSASPKAPSGYAMINRSDAGGKYQGVWEITSDSWQSKIINLSIINNLPLPKTGY